ncbi:uncharacterized protein G2W53_041578 [Senna tora]|uniref:Uncharacterized protein n=1 Tax=Senna tora TaxID=362788 RepID=A0A834SFN6_9FABA|nr:uncharacterized protein G2W53_041578 [Senna tora]
METIVCRGHTNAEQNEIDGGSLRRTTPAAVAMSRRRTP